MPSLTPKRRHSTVTAAYDRVGGRSSASETFLTITGALDASNIAQIRANLAEVTVVGKSFRLDLSGVDFFAARYVGFDRSSMLPAAALTRPG